MAQTNYTPISLYYSTTASAVPTAANLVPGELAINTNDGKLYYEDSSGVVRVLASKSTGTVGGSTTQVQFNSSGSLGGSSGLTWDGSFLTTSSIKNSALTSGRVTYAGASGLLSDSTGFTFDGTYVNIGTGLASLNGLKFLANAGGLAASLNVNHSSGEIQNYANTNYFQTVYTNNTEKMRITTTGLVGIGTTSPTARLTVSDSADGAQSGTIRVGDNGTYYGENLFRYNSSEYRIGVYPSGNMTFYATGSENMRLTSSGNLLVGTTSTPDGTSGGAGFIREGNARSTLFMASNTTGGTTLVVIRNPNGDVGTISTSGSLTSYNVTSDYRLKENIAPMSGALAKVAQLKPVTYKWKSDGSNGQGFIAHELAEVVPECVTGEKDAIDANGKPKYQGMDASFLIATLVSAIQELKAEFDAYKATHP